MTGCTPSGPVITGWESAVFLTAIRLALECCRPDRQYALSRLERVRAGYLEGLRSMLDRDPRMTFDVYPRGEALYDAVRDYPPVARVVWFTQGLKGLESDLSPSPPLIVHRKQRNWS
jgi:hypothetical protein